MLVPAAISSLAPPAQRGNGAKAHILVIEDDASSRDILRVYLEDAGFEVTAARGPEDALVQLDGRRPDLITLDLVMPGMDGYAFLATQGDSQQLRGVPVLVVSGADEPKRALAIGAQAVLTKPILRHELLAVVRKHLRGTTAPHPHVLVVDDDPKAIRIITDYFVGEGVEVQTAHGGAEALQQVERQPPDVMILDLMMPGVSGFDVLAQLRSNVATESLPVIVLTARTLTRADREGFTDNVRAVLGKAGIGRADLIQEVRKLVAQVGRGGGSRGGPG